MPDEACKPLTDLLVVEGPIAKYAIDVQAGLAGTDTLHQYPCLHVSRSKRFFVWLGATDFDLFSKCTFMNLCNFAEGAGAQTITFLLDAEHAQKSQYRAMFKVIDAHRVGSEAVRALVGAADKRAAREVTAKTTFCELAL